MYNHRLILRMVCILLRNQICHVIHISNMVWYYQLLLKDVSVQFYMLVDTNIFLLQQVYNIMSTMFVSKSWKISISRKFPYPRFLQGFLHNLIPGLPYPRKIPYPEISPYDVIASMLKYEYFFKRNTNQNQKISDLNGSWYVLSPFLM